jgi:endonuclease YncB( thermonuclease family)
VPQQVLTGEVIEVYDGDTATVLTAHPEAKYRVRFFGIDAPEVAMAHGRDAKKALQDKILGKDVLIKQSIIC